MLKASRAYRAFFVVSLAGAGVSSHAFTVATFSDPSTGWPPLFSVTSSTISGGWSGTGLNLHLVPINATFTNVTFTMAPVARIGMFGLGSGSIVFLDSASNPLLTITFGSGSIATPFFFGSSYANLDNVHFSSPYLNTSLYTNEQFAFSFANQNGTNGDYTYTASFTSSAEAVPEPASLAFLGLGALALMGRRFRKA